MRGLQEAMIHGTTRGIWLMNAVPPLSFAQAVVTMFELAEEHGDTNLNTDSTRI